MNGSNATVSVRQPKQRVAMTRSGAVYRARRTVTQEDFDRFAEISGDDNPIHVNQAFASKTRFGRTLAHGMFLFGLIAREISSALAPAGAEVVDHLLKFPGPTFAGDELELVLEVLDHYGAHATVRTTIVRTDGSHALEGEALVRFST